MLTHIVVMLILKKNETKKKTERYCRNKMSIRTCTNLWQSNKQIFSPLPPFKEKSTRKLFLFYFSCFVASGTHYEEKELLKKIESNKSIPHLSLIIFVSLLSNQKIIARRTISLFEKDRGISQRKYLNLLSSRVYKIMTLKKKTLNKVLQNLIGPSLYIGMWPMGLAQYSQVKLISQNQPALLISTASVLCAILARTHSHTCAHPRSHHSRRFSSLSGSLALTPLSICWPCTWEFPVE